MRRNILFPEASWFICCFDFMREQTKHASLLPFNSILCEVTPKIRIKMCRMLLHGYEFNGDDH